MGNFYLMAWIEWNGITRMATTQFMICNTVFKETLSTAKIRLNIAEKHYISIKLYKGLFNFFFLVSFEKK